MRWPYQADTVYAGEWRCRNCGTINPDCTRCWECNADQDGELPTEDTE